MLAGLKFHASFGLYALCITALTACNSLPDRPFFEASLSVGDANRILRSSDNEPQRAYAVRQLDQAAQQGDERAARILARHFRRGPDINQDLARAAEYQEMLLAAGHEDVRSSLARLYLTEASPAYNPIRGRELLDAAAQDGDAAAALQLARLLDASDPNRAIGIREDLATRGDAEAQLELATLLVDPSSVAFDPERGLALYEQLARSGNGRALFALGTIYRKGEIVDRDLRRSLSYFERGVVAGDRRSTLQFALALFNGRGIETSEARGLAMIEDLAEQGSGAALWHLGRLAPRRYTILVQDTLFSEQFYAGDVHGVFDTNTLIAFESFCAARSVNATCAIEPFAREAANAVAAARR
ncbi:tetratricopeptide repeat protein [Pontivivens ytuae]|uniref:Sel1 repeat family protein n=1 Tax=Pontivivens ytuae TaxID=2789856 RepID=A0A7S9LVD0_9RHOB|nr:sel1 repeat family protein [Pontivivens ytuae]QPH55949.1 sel1 repeat family protein [Pontivivens ytuae]